MFSRFFAVCVSLLATTVGSTAPSETAGAIPTPAPVVLERTLSGFTDEEYARAAEDILTAFERQNGRSLTPGKHRKVGLKIYADSGPGLATPVGLVKGVMAALERRGYERRSIFLVGLNQLRLRLTGYLPSLASGYSPFKGNPIYVLESGKFYDPVWFYDSPLPTRFEPVRAARDDDARDSSETKEELEADRKSFLATPLFLEADFWINLPVYTDHPVLGINGALVNATLWNASNTYRFFRSPGTAPAAVAEMAAIPELREGWAFSLVSLERYQFIGGPFFNSLYTRSEPRLWASADPVLLDALMLERINRARQETGFKPIDEEMRLLDYAEQLGVGSAKPSAAQFIQAP